MDTKFDLSTLVAGPTGLIVVDKEDQTQPDAFTFRLLRLPSGKLDPPRLLPGVPDNTEVYDASAGRRGFALLTQSGEPYGNGRGVLVTMVSPDGRVAWQKLAADGGARKTDPSTGEHYDDDSGRWAVQVVGDGVYVGTDAGVQSFAAADGARRQTPAFFDNDDALVPHSVVQDRFTVADEDDVVSMDDQGVRATVLDPDGSAYLQYHTGAARLAGDGSGLVVRSDGDVDLQIPGSPARHAPPPGRATSWDDFEGGVTTCGGYLYTFDGFHLDVSMPPQQRSVSSFEVEGDVEDTELSDYSVYASPRAVVIVDQVQSPDDTPVLSFAVATTTR